MVPWAKPGEPFILNWLNRKVAVLCLKAASSLIIFLLLAAFVIYQVVEGETRDIFSQLGDVPPMPCAIVFGAGIASPEVRDRVQTAVALYKEGKVKKLLMTGDNGHVNYNEPLAMRQEALELGVPAADVVCDYAGFRTYDSLYRARDIFKVEKAVLVTQRYHLPRAMYLARRLGLTVVGIGAGRDSYGSIQTWYDLREIGAAQAAWLDTTLGRKPKYLGKVEPIFP